MIFNIEAKRFFITGTSSPPLAFFSFVSGSFHQMKYDLCSSYDRNIDFFN